MFTRNFVIGKLIKGLTWQLKQLLYKCNFIFFYCILFIAIFYFWFRSKVIIDNSCNNFYEIFTIIYSMLSKYEFSHCSLIEQNEFKPDPSRPITQTSRARFQAFRVTIIWLGGPVFRPTAGKELNQPPTVNEWTYLKPGFHSQWM